MKKAKKGLLLSLLTLLMAVAVTATSTYAWFVVNRTVTASNMQVTVKSDTTWLAISGTSTLGAEQTFSATASSAEVLPVKYDTSADKWKIATGTSYTDGTASGGYSDIGGLSSYSGYAVKYTFYVGLTATTAENQHHLKVASMSVTNSATENPDNTFRPAVSALVHCNYDDTEGDNDGAKVNYTDIYGMNETAYTAKGDLLGEVVVGTAYQIDVYVYINGDNSVVTSANAANLGAFKLSITFSVAQNA